MTGGRLLLCAPASGGGKTTVTCGLLQALMDRGAHPVAFKSGPDYIDPMFHSRIIGAKSRNLDLFLMGEAGVKASLLRNTQEGGIAILEGAMGYYDGIAMGDTASAYDLAKTTQTPAVLVLDARGRALSAAALVKGFLTFRPDHNIQGVILNRISAMLYPRLKEMIETELDIPVYGYLPERPDCALESRHLGLVTAEEVEALQEKMSTMGKQAEETIDIDGLLALARTAPELVAEDAEYPEPVLGRPRIAVAQDKAFCFYYADALGILTQLGAELVPFSPMHDPTLPPDIAGLYLGGGYPELYAKELSQQTEMCQAVTRAIEGGLPTIAECGGFLYLHTTLEGVDGVDYPLCNYIQGRAFRTKRLGRFGYLDMKAKSDGLLCMAGESLPSHEFHYWDSQASGTDFAGQKPQSDRGWDCGYHTPTLYAGFPHCHLGGKPHVAKRFLKACLAYKERLT